MAEDIFITAAARTAMGSFQGALRDLTAPEIGGTAIAAVLDQQSVNKNLIDEVIRDVFCQQGWVRPPPVKPALREDSRNLYPAPQSTKCAVLE